MDVTAIVGGSIGAIVWLIRLEGRTRQSEKRIDDAFRQAETFNTTLRAVESNHNQLALRVVEELGRIREALARIEGRMSGGESGHSDT